MGILRRRLHSNKQRNLLMEEKHRRKKGLTEIESWKMRRREEGREREEARLSRYALANFQQLFQAVWANIYMQLVRHMQKKAFWNYSKIYLLLLPFFSSPSFFLPLSQNRPTNRKHMLRGSDFLSKLERFLSLVWKLFCSTADKRFIHLLLFFTAFSSFSLHLSFFPASLDMLFTLLRYFQNAVLLLK